LQAFEDFNVSLMSAIFCTESVVRQTGATKTIRHTILAVGLGLYAANFNFKVRN